MKKNLVGIFLCMLVALPSFSMLTLANPSDAPHYLIGLSDSKTIDKEIVVTVTNIGDTTEVNVPWSMEFQRFPGSSPFATMKIQGTIDRIAPQESVYLKSKHVFGVKMQSAVNVTVGDQTTVAGWRNILGLCVIRPTLRPYTTPYYFQDSDFIARFVSADVDSKIKVQVTNVGNDVHTNVEWFIGINQYYVLRYKHLMQHNQGIINTIAPGESVIISYGPLNVTGFYPWSFIQVSIDGHYVAFDRRNVMNSQIIKPQFVPYDFPLGN